MVGTIFLVIGILLVVGILPALIARRIHPEPRKPKPIQAAISELTAHKLLHQSWMEGQRLAATWWEEQCACPEVRDYRDIPGCARISGGVCVSWESDVLDWHRKARAAEEMYAPTNATIPLYSNPNHMFNDYMRMVK